MKDLGSVVRAPLGSYLSLHLSPRAVNSRIRFAGRLRYNLGMEKGNLLKQLQAEIIGNRQLPLRESNLVFGEGNGDCQVMFIGEAPGVHEDQVGRPFVGRAGQLLRRLIKEIGWREQDVYITNIVKRRPPENRDPSPEEIEAYKPYLTRQIEIIDPKVIVPLGRFSMNYFLPEAKISRDQGKIFKVDGRIVFPMFHPAAALRATHVLDQLTGTFFRLPAIVSGKESSAVGPLDKTVAKADAGESSPKKPGIKQPTLF